MLEASAGTGKTWVVAALVTRYVAEGRFLLPEMLVITFGRAASRELRDRVRGQLVEAERELADPEAARAKGGLVGFLAEADDAEVAERRRRVGDALASYDSATIATIHQFCQQVLRSLGVAGDTDMGASLVESLHELTEQVVDDVCLRRFQGREKAPFKRSLALQIGRAAVEDPQALIAPIDPDARVAGGGAGGVRAGRPRRGRGAQAPARDPQLRRPALAAGRRARSRGLAGTAADAAPLEGRARRRVPGHRPGAVGGAHPCLPGSGRGRRRADDGADRRPEAGHLRLPGRRHPHLPPRPGRDRRRQHPRHQLAQ